MLSYQNQRLPTSKKDKNWRIKTMNYFCNVADDFYLDWYRIEENYALKNNQLDQDEYRDICRGLGGSNEGKIFVNAYNKTHNVIDAMKGEEWNRPFAFDVVNNSPEITNRIEREKQMELDKLAESIFELEVKKVQEMIKAEIDARMANLQPQEVEQLQQQITQKYEAKYKTLSNPKSIFEKYQNITVAEEITVSRIMRMMAQKLNLKWVKNQTFEDALIAGIEAIEVYIAREGDLPKLKQLNPLNLFYEKSPDVQFIQDGDYAGYKQNITVGRVIEEYGDKLSKEDYEKLTAMGYHKGVTGLNHPFSTNRKAPSIWKDVMRLGRFPSGKRLSAEDYIILDEKYGGPSHGYISAKYIDNIGLSASETRRNYSEYLSVYTVYWKSQRRLGKLDYINDYGELDTAFVDEDFPVPSDAEKTLVEKSMFTKDTVVYVWTDNDGNKNSLEWIWVPEVWKGVRIGSDIFVDVGPLEDAYQSLLNPYQVKLPIYGYIYNNRNAFSISVMDRMKPWQKLYYVIMARFLKLISQDRGVLTFLNVHLFDKNLGVEKTLQIAEDQGILLYNPLSNAKGAGGGIGLLNTMKVADKIDATNSNVVQYYIQILQFIESNIKVAAGMSEQRLAQSNPRMTATDNYRETMHSVNMTEPLHAAHDLLWQEILQGMMEMTISVLSVNSGKLRGFLNDEEKVIIDLNLIRLEDNYILKIADNSKAFRVLEQAKQLGHALVQNNKAGLDTLIHLLETENLSEFKTIIRKVEMEYQDRAEQQEQANREHQKEMLQMQLDAKEDEQIADIDKEYMKGMLDYMRDEMKSRYQAMSFDVQKDYNKDGVPDYMQINQLIARIENEKKKLELDEKKIEQKERELQLKNQDKSDKNQMDYELKQRQMEQKERLNDKEIMARQRIEKMKADMKKAITNRKV